MEQPNPFQPEYEKPSWFRRAGAVNERNMQRYRKAVEMNKHSGEDRLIIPPPTYYWGWA